MSLKAWLQTRIDYEENYCIGNVVKELCEFIVSWIDGRPELECEYDDYTFFSQVSNFIYQRYHLCVSESYEPYDEDLYEYFSLTFSQDIVDLFMKFKETTRCYNLSLFHKKDVSLDLQEFLFDHLLIEDPYIDSDEENNIDTSIDES